MGLCRKGRGGGGGGDERESCAGRGRNWNGLESHTEWAAVACSPQSAPELIAEGIEGLSEQDSDSRRGKTLLDPPLTAVQWQRTILCLRLRVYRLITSYRRLGYAINMVFFLVECCPTLFFFY